MEIHAQRYQVHDAGLPSIGAGACVKPMEISDHISP